MTKQEQLNSKQKKKRSYYPRKAKCKICGNTYVKQNMQHLTCGMDCAIKYAKKHLPQKIAKEKNKKRKEELEKDKSYLIKKAQSLFNKYIRLRDKGKPCISCGYIGNRQIHAGHYIPVGRRPALRFNVLNCHAQCSICNNHKSGNLAEYRLNLIKKIGLEKVEWLESHTEVKKYDVEYLQRLIKILNKKIRRKND